MSDQQTELSLRVRARCDSDNLPAEHELRVLAEQFNVAVGRQRVEPTPDNAKRVLGCWSRLRRKWCEYSGEPLL